MSNYHIPDNVSPQDEAILSPFRHSRLSPKPITTMWMPGIALNNGGRVLGKLTRNRPICGKSVTQSPEATSCAIVDYTPKPKHNHTLGV